MSGTDVTVGDLLAFGLLPGHQVIAGRPGLERRVDRVELGLGLVELERLAGGALVVFERSRLRLEEVVADVAIRVAHARGLAGLVLERTEHALPEATVRLANRLRIPLVVVERLDAMHVASVLDRHVHGPQAAAIAMVDRLLGQVTRPTGDARALVGAVADVVGHPVALVDAHADTVAGDLALDADVRARLRARLSPADAPSMVTEFSDGHMVLCHPAFVGDPTLWLLVRLPVSGRGTVDAVRRVLGVAALAFTSWIAASALTGEREARYRAGVLTDILADPGDPDAATVERATALGWRLSGWHVAVHLTVERTAGQPTATSIFAELERVLALSGVTASLVQRPESWAFWTTFEATPGAQEVAGLARRVGQALRTLQERYPDADASAGLGDAHEGPHGIGTSLREAWQACLLARARGGGSTVEDFGAMTVDRLLVGWYESAPLQRATASLLEPLRSADASGELARTLMVYLDLESSATATAHTLRVHRNTVLQRLERARTLLPLDLARPNDRLVTHLALRVALEEPDSWAVSRSAAGPPR